MIVRPQDLKGFEKRFAAAGLTARLVEADDPDAEDDEIEILRDGVDTRVKIQIALIGGNLYVNEYRGQDATLVMIHRGEFRSLRTAIDRAIEIVKAKANEASSNVVVHIDDRVKTIISRFAQPWRWFCDGDWIVLEPPRGIIAAETVNHVSKCPDVHTVEAVFRTTPRPGVYLRFRLHSQKEAS